MRDKFSMVINDQQIDVYVEGYTDGSECEIEKIIAKYGNKEVFRVEDKQEKGLLAYTEVAGAIVDQSTSLLCQKWTESSN